MPRRIKGLIPKKENLRQVMRKFIARAVILISLVSSIIVFPCVTSAQTASYTYNPCAPSNQANLINTPITVSAAATSVIAVAPAYTNQKVYVCKIVIIGGGATNVTLQTGTGALCATGLTSLTGPVPLAAQAGWVEAPGNFPAYAGVAGGAICLLNSAAVQVSGSILTITQ